MTGSRLGEVRVSAVKTAIPAVMYLIDLALGIANEVRRDLKYSRVNAKARPTR